MTQIQIISSPSEVQKWVEEAVSNAFAKLTNTSANAPPLCKPLTAAEMREFLGISYPTLQRWTARGKIPCLRIGGSVRYDRNAVIKALETKLKK